MSNLPQHYHLIMLGFGLSNPILSNRVLVCAFQGHLARTSTLGLIEGGWKPATESLKLNPDFVKRGRILIRHYVKFEDIVEWVIRGLDTVDVEVL